MNVFYFPTGDSKKDSGLEIEFMVDTGAACSIINYRTFCEISQFLQPITVVRSRQKTRTYTGEEIPMLGHTTLNFSFDSDGQHCFQLQLWITETKTANLLGIEFCRKYISKLHFDIPALELKDTPNTICYGSLCATKPYPYLSLIRAIRIPHQIHIDAKTSRVYKYQPEDEQTNFASGTTFIPHQKVANSGLDFVNVLCTQSEQYLPILMENNKNHQITLDKGILGYSSLDILDFERPKYQIKDCVKMVDCILSENDQYNECFLLHSTLPHEPDFRDGIRIIIGNDDTIFENQTAIAHCISADAKMTKGFAETISNHISGLQEYCYKSKAFVGSVIPFWDNDANRFIYNLVTKNKFFEKPTLENLRISLENMRGHALLNNVQIITMPKIGCGLDKLFLTEVLKTLKDIFTDSGILIQIISRNELDCKTATKPTNSEDYIENQIDSYANE